jgi:hypothetical protein
VPARRARGRRSSCEMHRCGRRRTLRSARPRRGAAGSENTENVESPSPLRRTNVPPAAITSRLIIASWRATAVDIDSASRSQSDTNPRCPSTRTSAGTSPRCWSAPPHCRSAMLLLPRPTAPTSTSPRPNRFAPVIRHIQSG